MVIHRNVKTTNYYFSLITSGVSTHPLADNLPIKRLIIAMDELCHAVAPLWTLGKIRKCVKWQREIDGMLSDMLQRPLTGVEMLWLHDLNKEEYKMVAAAVNEGKFPDLTELGITMWK